MTSENDSKKIDSFNADRSIFVQELIFAFLSSSVANLPPEQLIRSKSTPPSIQSSVEEICRTNSESLSSINNESSSVINNKINNNQSQQSINTANPSNQHESNQQQPYIISIQQQNHQSDNNSMKTSDQNGDKIDNNNKMKIETLQNNDHNSAHNPPPISSNGSRNINESNDINSQQQQRQKPMSILMQPTNGTGVGTATFIGPSPLSSSTSMNVNHRLNKVSKVRSSPAIVHHSAGIRHSSLHSTSNVVGPVVSHGNLVVSPPNNGRRKILRPQPHSTEPPPHYE